jgi:hypothetical protein
MLAITVLISVSALTALLPAAIASWKNHSFWLWWLYGFLILIVALPHAIFTRRGPPVSRPMGPALWWSALAGGTVGLMLAVMSALQKVIPLSLSAPVVGFFITIVGIALVARVAIAILPERRWRTPLIVGGMFLVPFLAALRYADPAFRWGWDQDLQSQLAHILGSALASAIPAFVAWLVCALHRRAARREPRLAQVFD